MVKATPHLSHVAFDLIGETLSTERLVRTVFAVVEGIVELVLVTLEAQLLSKLTILLFQFRC